MFTRTAILLVPFMAILSVSDIILEDGADTTNRPDIVEKRIKVRAFYAKVLLNFCVTFIGAYLSIAQVAKNYKVYHENKDKKIQTDYEKLFNNGPIPMIILCTLFLTAAYFAQEKVDSLGEVSQGDSKFYFVQMCIVLIGIPVLSEVIEFMLPEVSKALQN